MFLANKDRMRSCTGSAAWFFSAGLTLGPLLAGSLRESIGYGNMNAVLAGICGLTSLACFFFLGGQPKRLATGRVR